MYTRSDFFLITYRPVNSTSETAGQKAILIGAGGAMLKRIGETARLELEELTGHPVYLDLWVKVSPHWRQSEPVLRRLGL